MKKIYIVMAVLATAALASCQQEKSFNDEQLGDNSVVFTISGGATRAADATPEVRQGVVIPLETEDGSKFFLEETVVNLNEIGPATKGTPAYTENLGTLYANDLSVYGDKGSFTTAATYQNMETSMYARKDASQGEGWRYQHNYNGDPWPTDGSAVGFYLNIPASPAGITGNIGRANRQFTFTYTSPTTAAEQQDILFAYRSMTKDEHMGFLPNGTPVLFNHALTAVKFAIGNEDADNIAITEIIFNNLVDGGTCEISPASEDNYKDNTGNYSSAGVTTWKDPTVSGDPISSGVYDGKINYNASEKKFGDSWYSAGNKNNLNDADGTQTFWLVPQKFDASSSVTLTIKYTVNGKSDEWTIDFGKALANVEWKAGDLRTYTIKVDDVDVTITDTVSETKKEEVTITNDSNVDVFIRAAIVGQWVDEKNNPVFSFTDFKDGNLIIKPIASWYQDQFGTNGEKKFGTFEGLPGTGWEKGENDDFYYYTLAVEPGATTGTPLFESYTVKTENIPNITVGGIPQHVHFVLSISTQAISAKEPSVGKNYTSYKAAWAAAEAAAQAAK